MANLYTGTIKTETYKTLASLTGVTFTSGTKYVIQLRNSAYIREGTNGKGFIVLDSQPFEYTAGDDDLYIKTYANGCTVNIAS